MSDKELEEFRSLSSKWASGQRMSKKQMLRALDLKRRYERQEQDEFTAKCAARRTS